MVGCVRIRNCECGKRKLVRPLRIGELERMAVGGRGMRTFLGMDGNRNLNGQIETSCLELKSEFSDAAVRELGENEW